MIKFLTQQQLGAISFIVLLSQPVVVAFSLTCPQLSVTAAGHLPETRATPTDSDQQAVPQWALGLRVTFPQCQDTEPYWREASAMLKFSWNSAVNSRVICLLRLEMLTQQIWQNPWPNNLFDKVCQYWRADCCYIQIDVYIQGYFKTIFFLYIYILFKTRIF